MAKTISDAIAEIQQQIGRIEEEGKKLKQKVNFLCDINGSDPIYPDASDPESGTCRVRSVRLRPDEFTADKLGKATRRYLEMRREANPDNAPAKIEEIRDALLEGGFDFRGKDPLQSVSVSLGKSSHTFKRLNNAQFGLASWYGPVRSNRGKPEPEDESEEVEETNNVLPASHGNTGIPSKEGGVV